MTDTITLTTERLVLRQWRDSDYPVLSRMNADPVGMKYYPGLLDEQASTAMGVRMKNLIDEHGWGFWALELKQDTAFIGFVGLHIPSHEFRFSPCVEIGWRLDRVHWGRGYATEAAVASLAFGFGELNLASIVSFTAVNNQRSRAVMERLGMTNTGENFQHPALMEGDPLKEHVLYKLTQAQWRDRYHADS